MVHQYMPKIFHDLNKNPPAPLLHTYCIKESIVYSRNYYIKLKNFIYLKESIILKRKFCFFKRKHYN